MRRSGILQGLATACGAIALGIACLVAAPTPAHAVSVGRDGVTVEATDYICENGHKGRVRSLWLLGCRWVDDDTVAFVVMASFLCDTDGQGSLDGIVASERTVETNCQGSEVTIVNWISPRDSITFRVTATSGHHSSALRHVAAKAATCTSSGNIEYWECPDCNKKYSDEQGTQLIRGDVVVSPTHDLEHVAAVDATCENEGNVEYWECRDCHKLYGDAAGKQELSIDDVTIPYAHVTHHVDAKAPTCTEDGWFEHYVCEKCGGTFLDAEGYWGWGVVRPKGHSLLGVDAKTPTCTEAGNIAYNECEFCHKKFADEQCAHELTDDEVTIAPVAHTFENGVCTVCGVEDPNYQAQGNDPADKPQGEKPAGNPAGKLPAAKPVAGKPTAATKLGAAKLLPQTGEEAAPIAAVLALGVGAAVLGIRRRRSNN